MYATHQSVDKTPVYAVYIMGQPMPQDVVVVCPLAAIFVYVLGQLTTQEVQVYRCVCQLARGSDTDCVAWDI